MSTVVYGPRKDTPAICPDCHGDADRPTGRKVGPCHRRRRHVMPVIHPVTMDEAMPKGELQDQEVAEIQGKGLRIDVREVFECERCDSRIPAEFVIGELLPAKGIESPRRRYRAYCSHCGIIHERETQLVAGVWRAVTASAIVLDRAEARRVIDTINSRIRGGRDC